MPFASEAPTCALMEATGIVYCAEGRHCNGFASYNIATNTWTPLASTTHLLRITTARHRALSTARCSCRGRHNWLQCGNVWVYDVALTRGQLGTAAPDGFLLAGYQQVGQFLYLAGGWTGGAPTGLTTTRRLDMSSAPGAWENGPAFTDG